MDRERVAIKVLGLKSEGKRGGKTARHKIDMAVQNLGMMKIKRRQKKTLDKTKWTVVIKEGKFPAGPSKKYILLNEEISKW